MPDPTFPGVFIEEVGSPPLIVGLPTAVAAFVGCAGEGPSDLATAIGGASAFEIAFGAPDRRFPLTLAVRDFFANGGEAAVVVRLSGQATSPENLAAALAALDEVDLNILHLSPDRIDGEAPRFAREAAAAYVERRRAMLILDPLAAWSDGGLGAVTAEALGDFSLAASGRTACYLPRLRDADGVRPAGGAVAGIWARIDGERGVWAAPAGVHIAVQGAEPERTLSDNENGALNERGFNALRLFPGAGFVVWGARTLAAPLDPAARYVPLRRLVDHVEASVERGLDWALFHAAGPPLWTRVTAQVETFLVGLWRAGALAGVKPSEAFVVICGARNNTPADVAEGRLRVDIGLAVQRPAEFVVTSIQVSTGAA
ncbi:phage tail sheath family protein [Caulobacter hibisci]|uniref:Phage tail sheath family protein n=1 Tax=Caulobacter hibisci TaxID=2035993 RepID=A0ABS0SW36_9CAUL|nr:phage tail sheath subtilisin-like domain-containing protein [Caulobacter hibisci]MBI1683808.1 phage tail sheath family protein [Caulobacter hibisci]